MIVSRRTHQSKIENQISLNHPNRSLNHQCGKEGGEEAGSVMDQIAVRRSKTMRVPLEQKRHAALYKRVGSQCDHAGGSSPQRSYKPHMYFLRKSSGQPSSLKAEWQYGSSRTGRLTPFRRDHRTRTSWDSGVSELFRDLDRKAIRTRQRRRIAKRAFKVTLKAKRGEAPAVQN